MFGRRRRPGPGSIYSFIITWLILSLFFPMYELSGILIGLGFGLLAAFLVGRASGKRAARKEREAQAAQEDKAPRKTVNTTVRKVGEKPAEKRSLSVCAVLAGGGLCFHDSRSTCYCRS